MKWIATILFCCCFMASFAQAKEEQNLLIKKTTNFYAWYKKNTVKVESFNLYKGKGKENNPPYHINWKEAERYFAFMKTSTAIGNAFVSWHKKDFKRIEQWFKDEPTEEIPAGFDYERIVGGQVGIEEALAIAFPKEGKWIVKVNGLTATVSWVYQELDTDTNDMKEQRSTTEFKKENGVWKIARTIGMMEVDSFDEEEKKASYQTI